MSLERDSARVLELATQTRALAERVTGERDALDRQRRKLEQELTATRLERDAARASTQLLSEERDDLRARLTAAKEWGDRQAATVAELWIRLRFAETPADPEVSYDRRDDPDVPMAVRAFAIAHGNGLHRGRPREGCSECEVQLGDLLDREAGCVFRYPDDTLCGVFARHHDLSDDTHPYRAAPDLLLGPVDVTRGLARPDPWDCS